VKVALIAWRELANPSFGGSEIVVDRVAQAFVDRGWDVSLYCGGPVAARSYHVIDNGGRFTQYLRAPLRWRQARRADVVIDVSNGIPFFSSLWLRKPSICLVHHVHDRQWHDVLPGPIAAIGSFVERRVVPRIYRRFWSISPSTTADLVALGLPRNRIREVLTGIEVAPERPDGSDRSTTPLFVVLGRLVPHKGVDRVLEAWQQIGQQIGGELVVVGNGPLREELEARSTPNTRFVGHVSDAERDRLLRSSWALVHGAHHEGWGVVVMEAAAVGVPTVGFAVRGIRDAVVDGSTGLLADNAAEFVDNWLRLAVDPDLRNELGAKAWERASALSWGVCTDSVAQMVEDAAAGTW
jgi:glycosyltransferase involved in cell wall biosynthesis